MSYFFVLFILAIKRRVHISINWQAVRSMMLAGVNHVSSVTLGHSPTIEEDDQILYER